MSFFDEADEPRTAPRPAPRRRRTTGGGRRPPGDDPQVIFRRRAVAGIILVVVVILIGVLVNSCQVNAYHSSLKDYDDNVDAVIQQSNATGRTFFSVLTGGGGARTVYTSLNQARDSAANQLGHARGFSVPDNLKQTQQRLLLALQMRHDAIADVAANIEQALGGQTSRDAINAIAADMAKLYGSDVLYKAYVLPYIVGALKQAGIAVGGLNGQPVEAGQFLPDVRWLTPSFVASKLKVNYQTPTNTGPIAPGLHGHALNSVSVAGTTLQTGSTNTLTASPTPTFTLNFTNTGNNTETNVDCDITLAPTSGSGKSYSGHTVVAQTTAGQSLSCNVQLSSAAPAGSYTLTATIKPVPGEKNKNNNTMTFPVALQ